MRFLSGIRVLAQIALALPVVIGCSRRPDGILSEKDMVSVMADMQIAEAYTDIEIHGPERDDRRRELGRGVLEAHGITQAELDSTLAWYGRNLDDYTKLYDKVDKNLAARRKKLLAQSGSEDKVQDADMLWPWSQNGTISQLGIQDAFILSVPEPELRNGDALKWQMRLAKSVPMSAVLGVEYSDGTSEAVTQSMSGRQQLDISLQTDSAKSVKRIYGTLKMRDMVDAPVYADSIRLMRVPFDSIEYSKYRSQKVYGFPVRKSDKVEKKDTVPVQVDSVPAVKLINETKLPERKVELAKPPTVHDRNHRPRSLDEARKDVSKPSNPKTTPARRRTVQKNRTVR